MLPSLFLLVLVVAGEAPVGGGRTEAQSVEGGAGPRLVFGGPVEDEVLWDEQHLWVASRGGLYEIDACREAPRRVELPRGDPPARRHKSRDLEDELVLASLDDADWDDAVLEDFRDQEGLPPEEAFRRQVSVPALGPPVVLALARTGTSLDVVTAEGVWICQPDRAFCRAPVARRKAIATLDAKRPPEPREEGLSRWETSWGVWFINDQGVWFEAGEVAQTACAPLRESAGLPFVRPSVPSLSEAIWLPRVSLVGARGLRRAGASTRAETAVILLLTFSASRTRALGAFESDLTVPGGP